jgi:excisionase family DNA binding protein
MSAPAESIVPVPAAPLAVPSDPDTARLVSAAELAKFYGVSRAHIYNLMNRGMPSVKVGRCRRFRLAETDAWLDTQARSGKAS